MQRCQHPKEPSVVEQLVAFNFDYTSFTTDLNNKVRFGIGVNVKSFAMRHDIGLVSYTFLVEIYRGGYLSHDTTHCLVHSLKFIRVGEQFVARLTVGFLDTEIFNCVARQLVT